MVVPNFHDQIPVSVNLLNRNNISVTKMFLQQLTVEDLKLQNHKITMNHENQGRLRKLKITEICSYIHTWLVFNNNSIECS